MHILDNIKNLIEEAKTGLAKPKKGAAEFIQKLREEKKVPIKYPELDKAKNWHNVNKQEARSQC